MVNSVNGKADNLAAVLPVVARCGCTVVGLTLDEGGIPPTAEERLAIADIFADAKAGRLTEAFGTGTAAVISPVGHLCWKDETITLNGGEIGPVAQKLYDTLTGIQWGKLPDSHHWIMPL